MAVMVAGAVSVAAPSQAAPAETDGPTGIEIVAGLGYDSNVARSSEAFAASRGLEVEDTVAALYAAATHERSFGRLRLALEGDAGTTFHAENDPLNRTELGSKAGFFVGFPRCEVGVVGEASRRRTAQVDILDTDFENNERRLSIGAEGVCPSEVGIEPSFRVSFGTLDNSETEREINDAEFDTYEGALTYRQPSFGSVALIAGFEETRFPNRTGTGGDGAQSFELGSIGARYARTGGSLVAFTTEVRAASLDASGTGRDFDGVLYSGEVFLNPRGKRVVSFEAGRNAVFTNRVGVSYALENRFGGKAVMPLGARITVTVDGERVAREFAEADASVTSVAAADEVLTSLGGTAQRQIGRLMVGPQIRYEKRNSEDALLDFDGVSAGVTLTARY